MQKLIGSNILFNVRAHGEEDNVREGKVTELSPNGGYVKIGKGWFAVAKVNVLEVLAAKEDKAPEAKLEKPTGGTGATNPSQS